MTNSIKKSLDDLENKINSKKNDKKPKGTDWKKLIADIWTGDILETWIDGGNYKKSLEKLESQVTKYTNFSNYKFTTRYNVMDKDGDLILETDIERLAIQRAESTLGMVQDNQSGKVTDYGSYSSENADRWKSKSRVNKNYVDCSNCNGYGYRLQARSEPTGYQYYVNQLERKLTDDELSEFYNEIRCNRCQGLGQVFQSNP